MIIDQTIRIDLREIIEATTFCDKPAIESLFDLQFDNQMIFTRTIGVQISGQYRPATRLDPAEEPESEASVSGYDLAVEALAHLKKAVHLDPREAAEFLRAAVSTCENSVELACWKAIEESEAA